MKCAECQAELNPADRFCTECGHRVEAAASIPAPQKTPGGASVKEVRRFEGHQDEVMKVVFSPDGRRALSASRNGDIYVWDIETGRSIHRVLGEASLTAMDFSPDRKRALCNNGGLRLLDLDSTRPLARFAKLGYIHAVAFLPDGRSAVFGHTDHSVRQIELERGSELKRFDGQQSQPECLACSPDGRFVVSGRIDAADAENVVLIWDLKGGGAPRRPERVMSLVSSFAFSPDSRRAISGTYDTSIYLWDLATGHEIRRYEGHGGNVNCVAFSPTGRFVVSGSGTDAYDAVLIKDLGVDNTVRLWDAESTRELACFTGHERNVTSVAVSPDGRHVLSGSADKTVRLWAIPESTMR